jgi:hypothetical protein
MVRARKTGPAARDGPRARRAGAAAAASRPGHPPERVVRRRYSAKTSPLCSGPKRVSLGDTNVGRVMPRSLRAAASSAVSAIVRATVLSVEVAPTGGPQPSISTTASSGRQQLSMTMSATSASRLPLECRGSFISRLATEVTAMTGTPRSRA